MSRGRFLPRWFGAPVLVLETVGRRSGRVRGDAGAPQAHEYPGFTDRPMPLIALERS